MGVVLSAPEGQRESIWKGQEGVQNLMTKHPQLAEAADSFLLTDCLLPER